MDIISETVYIIGESRTNLDNAITLIYKSFYVAFEIEVETNKIVDAGCTHTIKITESFLKKLVVGKDFIDSESIEQGIIKRYHGTSQKALLVSYKDALKKYIAVKEKYYI